MKHNADGEKTRAGYPFSEKCYKIESNAERKVSRRKVGPKGIRHSFGVKEEKNQKEEKIMRTT